MSSKTGRHKCRHCKKFFYADYRNASHQHYCSAPACRQASKRAAQQRWTSRKANHDYFCGEHHVYRVQQWRNLHPGYWKRQKPLSQKAQPVDTEELNLKQRSCNVPPSDLGTLQDLCLTEHPAFVGLISMVTGSTLQEDIELTARKLLIQGQNILGLKDPDRPHIKRYEKASHPT